MFHSCVIEETDTADEDLRRNHPFVKLFENPLEDFRRLGRQAVQRREGFLTIGGGTCGTSPTAATIPGELCLLRVVLLPKRDKGWVEVFETEKETKIRQLGVGGWEEVDEETV